MDRVFLNDLESFIDKIWFKIWNIFEKVDFKLSIIYFKLCLNIINYFNYFECNK